ncbi:hypothetical protein [Thermoplasma sp.]|uniref:hypothetical protein n=1 Tax=Thermoplasma sp. TaxID=1973142 RepID=UPI001272AEE6|nr:hypothetical protein [Thermoplasma sp.]KAA8921852.1 MAG: hypothetical protein F6Q11_07420 [Thermoplasma sp.]
MPMDDIDRRVTVLEIQMQNNTQLIKEIAEDTKAIRKQLTEADIAAARLAGQQSGQQLAGVLLKRDKLAIYASLLVALISLTGSILARIL